MANVPKSSPSQIIGFRHDWKPARSWTEIRSSSLTMRGRSDERRQSSPQYIAFNSSDPNQRVRHRRSPSVEPIRRVRSRRLRLNAFVETTPERTRVRGWGTHAGPLLVALSLHYLMIPTGTRQNRDRPIRRNRPVQWKSHRRCWRRRRSLQINTRRRYRSTEKRSRVSGGKAWCGWSKGRRGRRWRRRIGAIEPPGRWKRPQNRAAWFSRRNRHWSYSQKKKREKKKKWRREGFLSSRVWLFKLANLALLELCIYGKDQAQFIAIFSRFANVPLCL